MNNSDRRYDFDWLRVIAIFLLIIYHTAIVFQPWGIFIGFIQSTQSINNIWIPMQMINVWRIPLLFFISGIGLGFAAKKRTIKELLKERTLRIFVPFIFGIFVIVPLHNFIFQHYYEQPINIKIQSGHLWFLGNIFLYVLILLPIIYFTRNKLQNLKSGLNKIYSSPFHFVFISIPFISETLILKPVPYELYATTLHGYILGFISFTFGYTFSQSDNFWRTVKKWRILYLTAAVILYILRQFIVKQNTPTFFLPTETTFWITGIFGWAYKNLNHSSKALNYLSKSVYPVYIIHMIFLFLASMFILPLALKPIFKFILITFFTITASFISYHIIIQNINILKPLFGLKKTSTLNS